MAFFPKLFSFLFLVALFSSLLPNIQGRESQFFSKVTNTNVNDNYNAKQSGQPSGEREQETRFQPGTQNYGISGELGTDSTGVSFRPDSTTTTTNIPYNPVDTEYRNAAATTTNQNHYYNGENGYNPATTTTAAAATTTSAVPEQNNYYNNAADKYKYNNQYASTRSGEQNGYNTQEQQQDSYNARQQHHGMSDTRYMYRGKYYYNVGKDNNVNGYNPQGVVSTNEHGTGTYYYGTNGYNGAHAEYEEEEKFAP